MLALVITIHILAALVLILVVLLQSGKAGDLASAFGGAGSQTAFGARGAATFLTRATAVSAGLFMLTSLTLAVLFTQGSSDTIMEGVPLPEEVPLEVPAEEAPVPAQPAAPVESAPAEPAAGEAPASEQ